MKKNTTNKLGLKVESLRRLDNAQLRAVVGGITGDRQCNDTISLEGACNGETQDFFCTVRG